MVFSSETFLFLFLPLFMAAYFATPTHARSWTILIGSYVFYAWWRVDFLLLLVGTTLWSFAFGKWISKSTDPIVRKRLLGIGVLGCLGVLGFFKYAGFFLDSVTALVGSTPDELSVAWRIILPIGISFYVFQSISFLVDTYRRDVLGTPRLIDYAAFIALFPQLIAGPILRFKDLAPQFAHRVHSFETFCAGCARFVVGLAMKVIIADSLAPLADLAFDQQTPDLLVAWLGAIAYALQIFFDFAGYSAMAIGLGLMMGFRFVENFNAPYHARSITDFWRRWHISLSVWLRDYLYIPLGGNRRGTVRTYLNLVTVMVLGGLWHGAAWTFVLWGLFHGLCLAAERFSGHAQRAGHLWWSPAFTLLLVLLGWVMFRAETPGGALSIYAGMLGLNGLATQPHIAVEITNEAVAMLLLASVLVYIEPQLKRALNLQVPVAAPVVRSSGEIMPLSIAGNVVLPLVLTCLFALSAMKMAEAGFSPFLYFRF